MNNLNKVLDTVEVIKSAEEIKNLRVYTDSHDDNLIGESKSWEYYFSISGWYDGDYFSLYMFKSRTSEDRAEIVGTTDEPDRLVMLLEKLGSEIKFEIERYETKS